MSFPRFFLSLLLIIPFAVSSLRAEDIYERLAALQQSTSRAQSEIAQLESQSKKSKQYLKKLKNQRNQLQRKEEELQRQLDDVVAEQEKIREEVSQLEVKSMELQQRRLERIQLIDQSEHAVSVLQLVVSAQESVDEDDFLLLTEALQRKENEIAREAQATALLLRERQKEQAGLLKKQQATHDEIREERVKLSKVVVATEEAKERLEEQEKRLRQQVMQLQAEALKLESVLSSWSEERAESSEGQAPRRVFVTPAMEERKAIFQKASLIWPIAGEVARSFGAGKKSDPQRNGVVFRASSAGSVRAVGSGVVSFLGKLPFFGRSVIVEHGDEEFSLYGGLRAVSKKLGAEVDREEALGAVESGDELYLELRKAGKSINPEPLFSQNASKY